VFTHVQPTVVQETSGTWGTPTAVALPAGAATGNVVQPHLDAVSCGTSASCAAVGDYPIASAGVGAMVALENAGIWGVAQSVALPAGATTGNKATAAFTGVWCSSTGDCLAVGNYTSASGVVPMVATETAGTWSRASRLPLFAGLTQPFGYVVTGLACTDVWDCTVVGDYTYSNVFKTVAFGDTEVGGAWAAPRFAPLRPMTAYQLNDVACPSATRCIGVGEAWYYVDHNGVETSSFHPAIVVESSGAWGMPTRIAEPDLSPLTDAGELSSIACASNGTCEAVGDTYNRHLFERYPFAITYANGRWSSGAIQRAIPFGASGAADFSTLVGVSCGDSTICMGVGSASLNPWSDPPYTYPPVFPFSTALAVARPLGVPGPPIRIRIASGIGAAFVYWQAPTDDGGAPIASFTATASPGGAHCTTAALKCVVRGLVNDRVYAITVTDRTSQAESPPSQPTLRVRIGVPTSPVGVQAAPGRGFVDISWHASSVPPDEPVLAYQVSVTGPRGELLRCSTTKLACRISRGLSRGSGHAVTVITVDRSGRSLPSARVIFIAR
jgi:hypothetical protein